MEKQENFLNYLNKQKLKLRKETVDFYHKEIATSKKRKRGGKKKGKEKKKEKKENIQMKKKVLTQTECNALIEYVSSLNGEVIDGAVQYFLEKEDQETPSNIKKILLFGFFLFLSKNELIF